MMADSDTGPALPGAWGQEDIQERLSLSVRAGRLPQSLLIHGPEGVGKRRLALWLAAVLQCESEKPPCAACRSCRLAARFEHPDIHLHFPMPRPKRASSRAKLREAIEKQRQERLAQLREDVDAELDTEDVTGLYVAAVENIRAQASKRPAMSKRVVFVIDDADRMVPQSSSPEAANAFLKLLEEPPDFAYIVLITSRPAALLPTIRSRTAPLRVPPIPTKEVVAYLEQRLGAAGGPALAAARQADGAVGRARRLLATGPQESDAAAARLLAAALAGHPADRYRAAVDFSARGARSVLEPALEDLRRQLRDVACAVSGADDQVLDPVRFETIDSANTASATSVLAALGAVDHALEGVSRNLNPQATVAVMLEAMSAALSSPTTPA